jgi:SAM-dependent methyltransferase
MMFVDNSDKSWEAYGREDPYFGVCIDPKFRVRQLTEAAREDFFNSGEEYVGAVLGRIEQRLGVLSRGKALDFGCGVGRIAIPLARRFEHATGLDISPSMIREAEVNCARYGVSNASFVLSGGDDLPNVKGQFDFVNTVIVLQHIPPSRGYRIIARLLDLVGEGGAIALHVNLCRRSSQLHKAVHIARRHFLPIHYGINLLSKRPWNEPLMQMNTYEFNRIALMMFDRGFEDLYGMRYHTEPHPGVVIMALRPAL